MCLALPSRVEQVEGTFATVDSGGQRRRVSLLLLEEPVAVGDYLLVRNGGLAYERLDAGQAEAALALIDEVIAQHGGADRLAW